MWGGAKADAREGREAGVGERAAWDYLVSRTIGPWSRQFPRTGCGVRLLRVYGVSGPRWRL